MAIRAGKPTQSRNRRYTQSPYHRKPYHHSPHYHTTVLPCTFTPFKAAHANTATPISSDSLPRHHHTTSPPSQHPLFASPSQARTATNLQGGSPSLVLGKTERDTRRTRVPRQERLLPSSFLLTRSFLWSSPAFLPPFPRPAFMSLCLDTLWCTPYFLLLVSFSLPQYTIKCYCNVSLCHMYN